MAKSTTPSFVTEVELLPTGKQAKKLRSKFEAARHVYNAVLGEALKRLRAMRKHPSYRWARIEKKNNKRRNELFAEAQKAVGFSYIDLEKWAQQFNHSWINEHIKARTVLAIVRVVFDAAKKKRVEPRRRMRFRYKGVLKSVEGNSQSDCRWKDDRIEWGKLVIPAQFDADDDVIKHGLSCPLKHVRMVRRIIRGRERFFAQLVCEGEPYRKELHRPNPGIVGVDFGPSEIAVVGERNGKPDKIQTKICEKLADKSKLIASLSRAMDDSKRATNPFNFNADGTIKPRNRLKKWQNSKRYHVLRDQLAAAHAKLAAHRKNIHGQLAAEILKLGDVVRLEDIAYKSWHKRKKDKKTGHRKKSYGRSMGMHAPGELEARIKSEAAKWGATVEECSTYKTKLTQTCHCGNQKKKSLSERVHRCEECGAEADRDLHSAYMARYVEHDEVRVNQSNADWSRFCAILGSARPSAKSTCQRSHRRKNRPQITAKRAGKRAGKTATPHLLKADSDSSSSGKTSCDRSVGDHPDL